MKTSDSGIKMIGTFEGCRLTAYWDKTGKVWTIGYGHTKGVKEGDKITNQQAIDFLKKDVFDAEASVNKYFTHYNWNQNEFDALVSFTFNCGGGALNKLLDNGGRTKAEIAEKILLYNKSGGVKLPGLTRRRKAEHDLFIKGTVASTLGWVQSNGKWYFRERPGVNAHGWKNIPPYRYYFNTDGSMAKGFITINGKLYYFRESGQGEGALYVSDSDGSLHTMKV